MDSTPEIWCITWLTGKSQGSLNGGFELGKSHIYGGFSIAIFDYRMVMLNINAYMKWYVTNMYHFTVQTCTQWSIPACNSQPSSNQQTLNSDCFVQIQQTSEANHPRLTAEHLSGSFEGLMMFDAFSVLMGANNFLVISHVSSGVSEGCP